MKKALGLAIVVVLALSGSVAAEQVNGTIRMIDRDNSIVLQDGTRLWVTEGQFVDLSLGDQVQAAYETKDGKNFVTRIDRYIGLDGSRNPLDSVQAGGDE